jgi:hypothetical protein
MARNAQTALYINDPVKIVAGVLTIRQAVYVAGIVGLTYALINATSRLPYGQSAAGQLHLLLIVGVPAGLGLLVATFAGSGTVEPYAPQLAGYAWRLLRATPRRLSYRATRLVAGRRQAPVMGARAGDGEAAGSTGTGHTIAPDCTATHASVRALAPAPAPLVAVWPRRWRRPSARACTPGSPPIPAPPTRRSPLARASPPPPCAPAAVSWRRPAWSASWTWRAAPAPVAAPLVGRW